MGFWVIVFFVILGAGEGAGVWVLKCLRFTSLWMCLSVCVFVDLCGCVAVGLYACVFACICVCGLCVCLGLCVCVFACRWVCVSLYLCLCVC